MLYLGQGIPTASAAEATVLLGDANSFAILAGSAVTNTGPTVVYGDLGVHPGETVSGFEAPNGQVNNGAIHAGDAYAGHGEADLTTAYKDAKGRTSTVLDDPDIGNDSFGPGVYKTTSDMRSTGRVTLNAHGHPDAVFIFQVGGNLETAPNSYVRLVRGASPCNVFWQVSTSVTLETQTDFVGSVMANSSISLANGVNVQGRLLARLGEVNLNNDTITRGDCPDGVPTTGASDTTTGSTDTTSSTDTTDPTDTTISTDTTAPTDGSVTTSSSGSTGYTTTTATTGFPSGHPHTGEGGAEASSDAPRAPDGLFIALGVLALGGASVAMGQAMTLKRRRAATRTKGARRNLRSGDE